MKKISFIGLAMLATAFMGCDEIDYSDSKPITNPQLPLVEAKNITVTVGSDIIDGKTVNLQLLKDNGTESIFVYSVDYSNAQLPDGAVVSGNFEISPNEDYSNSIIFGNSLDSNGHAYVSVDDLVTARTDMFGKNPAAMIVYYRVSLFAEYEDAKYQLVGESDYYLTGSFPEEGIDSGFVIEDTYYLLGPNGWVPETDLIKFDHSDKNPYDDPVFTVIVNAPAESYWKIVPQSVAETEPFNWDLLIGTLTDGDTSLSGNLTDINAGSGLLEEAGKYLFTVNMQTMEYTIEMQTMPDWIGTPNDSQGWNIAESQHLLPYDNKFKGFAYFGGEWGGKLAYVKADGTEVWIGLEGELSVNEGEKETTYTGKLLADAGGNIFEGGNAELYSIFFDWDTFEVTLIPITKVAIVGGFNDWSTDTAVEISPVEGSNNLIWSGTVEFETDTEWKFCFNGDWTVNLGGPDSDLKYDGDNLNSTAGTYNVTLDLSTTPYKMTIE